MRHLKAELGACEIWRAFGGQLSARAMRVTRSMAEAGAIIRRLGGRSTI